MTLKITPANESDAMHVLRLEGRLTEEVLADLRVACAQALGEGRPVVLHLAGVSFADSAGAEALRELERAGCVLAGCSDFLATLLRGAVIARAAAVPDADEDRLVRALQAGDRSAFETVVRRQGGPLLAVARRILASEDDARDAVQEAFVSAWRAIGGFDGTARLSTWLHRIVVNAALMKLRSRRRRPEEPLDELLPCFDENGAWTSGMAQPTSAPEAHVSARQTRELVRRCIARLPDAYRVVLVLRDIEDRDTGEVAAMLGVSSNAVKIRLHRARQALRTLLEGERALDLAPSRGASGALAASRRAGGTLAASRRALQREMVAA